MAKKKQQQPDAYSKYSNIAYQMVGVLGLSGYIGFKLDDYFKTEQPYITAFLMLFMLVTFLWKIVLETGHDAKKKKKP